MRQRERSDHAVCGKFFSMEGEFPTLDCGPLAGRNTCNKKGQEGDYCEPLAKKAFLKGDEDLGKTSPGWSCPGTGVGGRFGEEGAGISGQKAAAWHSRSVRWSWAPLWLVKELFSCLEPASKSI